MTLPAAWCPGCRTRLAPREVLTGMCPVCQYRLAVVLVSPSTFLEISTLKEAGL